MEIEVGDYIRTKGDGLIRKVKGIEKYKHTFDTYYICEKTDTRYMEEDIKKHSKNIIDLVEVGDILEIRNQLGYGLEIYYVKRRKCII